MSYLTWRDGTVLRAVESERMGSEYRVVYVCQANVEAVYIDDGGLLALTCRGVERVRVTDHE